MQINYCNKCGEDDQEKFTPSKKYICSACRAKASKAWRLANLERSNANYKLWEQDNLEGISARKKKYREDNLDACKARERAWVKNNRGKVTAKVARRNAKKLAQTPEDANLPLIEALYTRAAWLKKNFGVDIHVDHIHPISKGGQHTMSNLQLLPAYLNIQKGDKLWPEK